MITPWLRLNGITALETTALLIVRAFLQGLLEGFAALQLNIAMMSFIRTDKQLIEKILRNQNNNYVYILP